jgi:hypothetical protein
MRRWADLTVLVVREPFELALRQTEDDPVASGAGNNLPMRCRKHGPILILKIRPTQH